MTGQDGKAGARRCVACRAPLGSPVAFCPFCGAGQAVAAAAPPPLPPSPEPAPAPSPWSTPPAPPPRRERIVVRTPAPAPAASPAPAPSPPARPPARTKAWLGYVLFGVMVLGAVLAVLLPAPTGTVVASVRGPGGPVSTGRILVDGHPAGTPGQQITLSAGPHQLSFEDPGYLAEPATVTVSGGQALSATIVAKDRPARLALSTTPPGASVRMMGRSWGPTPVALELTPGGYDLTISLAGYAPKTVSVRLERGEARSLSVELAANGPPPPRFTPPPFERGVVVAGGGLLAGPAASAEIADALPPFSEVQVLNQVVTDETWLQLRAGTRQGFMRAGAVESWAAWAQRNSAAGPIDGMTPTMRLVLAGRPYTLAGVQAPDPSFNNAGLSRMQASLNNLLHGTQARCVPTDPQHFQCKTPEGRDIAEMYLLNGAALTAEGALPYYADALRTAREKQKGMWSAP